MPLALPLLIPFAEIAGIAIGAVTTGVGLKALSDKVEDYIEDNPENAEKIFAMIMPEQGLASIFNTEADDGEEISETEEVVEVKPKKLTGKEKGMRMRQAALQRKGNYSSPDAEGNYESKRGRMIRTAEELGLADPDLKDNYKKSNFDYKKYFRKADGGMMEYANGGGVGSMMEPKKKSYEDQSLTKAEQKKTKPVDQGGGPNYLGKQEEVTTPRKWLSSPDHVVAELAYITPREQKILLDANIYGSLKGKPNKGPNGIMSLQGDLGGYDASPGGPNSGGGGGNRSNKTDKNKQRAADIMRGNVTTGQTTKTGPRTRQYSNLPEWMKGPSGNMQHAASAYKSYGQPSFFGNLFSRGAPGYRGIKGLSAFGKPTFKNNGTNYITEDEDFGEVKPGMGGRILGGLASLLTGVPLVGSLIGNQIDKFKPKTYMEKQTPEELSRMRGLQMIDGQLVDTRMLDFDPNAQTQRPTSVPMDSLSLNNFNKQPQGLGEIINSVLPQGLTKNSVLKTPSRLFGGVTQPSAKDFIDLSQSIDANSLEPKSRLDFLNETFGAEPARITELQKNMINAQGKMGQATNAFDPNNTFDAVKGVFDKETGTYGFDDKGEKNLFSADRPAEPMTRPEYDAYLESQGYI